MMKIIQQFMNCLICFNEVNQGKRVAGLLLYINFINIYFIIINIYFIILFLKVHNMVLNIL